MNLYYDKYIHIYLSLENLVVVNNTKEFSPFIFVITIKLVKLKSLRAQLKIYENLSN